MSHPRCGLSMLLVALQAADIDPVFCHRDGSPYDPDTVTHRFERRAELCPDVIRIRFHGMHHTHATLLLENGTTAKYVAEPLWRHGRNDRDVRPRHACDAGGGRQKPCCPAGQARDRDNDGP